MQVYDPISVVRFFSRHVYTLSEMHRTRRLSRKHKTYKPKQRRRRLHNGGFFLSKKSCLDSFRRKTGHWKDLKDVTLGQKARYSLCKRFYGSLNGEIKSSLLFTPSPKSQSQKQMASCPDCVTKNSSSTTRTKPLYSILRSRKS